MCVVVMVGGGGVGVGGESRFLAYLWLHAVPLLAGSIVRSSDQWLAIPAFSVRLSAQPPAKLTVTVGAALKFATSSLICTSHNIYHLNGDPNRHKWTCK